KTFRLLRKLFSPFKRAQKRVERLRIASQHNTCFSGGESRGEELRPRQAILFEMLREFLKTLIEIDGIDLDMLNASDRVDSQSFSALHPHNLFHHLRAMLSAAPFL